MLPGVPVPAHHSAGGYKHKFIKCFLHDGLNYHELLKYQSYNDSTLTTDCVPVTQVTSGDPVVRSSLAGSNQK